MKTVNISLPTRLKSEAETLVKMGFYASFSDLVRDSLRQAISKNKYDSLVFEAKMDEKMGKAKILKGDDEIDGYVDSI